MGHSYLVEGKVVDRSSRLVGGEGWVGVVDCDCKAVAMGFHSSSSYPFNLLKKFRN